MQGFRLHEVRFRAFLGKASSETRFPWQGSFDTDPPQDKLELDRNAAPARGQISRAGGASCAHAAAGMELEYVGLFTERRHGGE